MAGKATKDTGATEAPDSQEANLATDSENAGDKAGAEDNGSASSDSSEVSAGDNPEENEDVTVVPQEKKQRKAVFFTGPYHRYSRGDTAVFDVETAESLVSRGYAVWPEAAKKALAKKPGDGDHDTDVG